MANEDILPELTPDLLSTSRGTMQRRIEQLEAMVLEIEYTASVIDRSPMLRIQQIRSQIQAGRVSGLITKQPSSC